MPLGWHDNVSGSTSIILHRQIFISSAGRTFVRQQGNAGRNGNKSDTGPEDLSGRFTFDGNSMTNFMGREGLLRRINVTFDRSFSGCSAAITIAREGAVAKGTGLDGAQYENLSAAVRSVSCSLKDGNALAG